MPNAPKVEARPTQIVLSAISSKAARVRAAATELSAEIESFEQYLGKLPGRVETTCFGDHPDAETTLQQCELSLVLKLHRKGKAWMISYSQFHEAFDNDPENPITFEPLKEAPLKFKIAAVKMFPNLLASIEKSQDTLIKEVEAATIDLKFFASSLPPLKEGK